MKSKEDSTKYLFLKEALKLFSEKGFESVKISEIADSIGCTAPALYKHYENKQALYKAILEESVIGYKEAIERLNVDIENHPERKEHFLNIDAAEFKRVTLSLFNFSIHDEWATNFRKLMLMEQFNKKELADMFEKRYIYLQYDQFAGYFKHLMDRGRIDKGDAQAMAISFISPITMLIGIYDRDNSKEEWCVDILSRHIDEFLRAYNFKDVN